jgi:endonuclease/exonuclease/phosphatase (EEP) superfamily protein YafD
VALWATVRLPTPLAGTQHREVTVATTHLSFVRGWNLWQLWTLSRELRGLPQPVVLCGDLNLSPRWAALASRLTPTVAAPTFPWHGATRQLDHVLVGDVPGPFSGSAVRTPISDHQALVVDFQVA